ncbi:MAG: hypothetical protein HXS52_04955 [Theionarchaea archaeon]|nr:hypothetical protein [Theionarchaea archaeon]MBU7037256.1 hypothetical protein [Theionarchaea archaeon]
MSEPKDTIEARNLALAYFVEALSNIGIEPRLIANYMARRIARDMDYFVDKYMDGISMPNSFLETVQLVAQKNVEKGLHGAADFDIQEKPFVIRVSNLRDCTFKGFAYEAVRKGQPGCPVCLITQISVGSIAAMHNLQIKLITRKYNMEKDACDVVIEFAENR